VALSVERAAVTAKGKRRGKPVKRRRASRKIKISLKLERWFRMENSCLVD
jgi:hypothetical protein